MRLSEPSFRVSLYALALAGCGGPVSAASTQSTVARGPEPCPTAGEVRLGRICWDPTGSRWHLTANAPGGEYAFDVELLPANRLRATDHPLASPATDEWFVEGNTLRLFLSSRFVEYRAELTNGTVMIGEAVNARGQVWDWRGDRIPTRTPCRPDEAELDGTCFALAGTRWTLRTGGAERVIHFDAGGRLLTEPDEDGEGTWAQQGAQIRFTVGGREHTATLGGSTRQLSGDGWSAERIDLYPPPMH